MAMLPALLLERIGLARSGLSVDTHEFDDLTTEAFLLLCSDGLISWEDLGLGFEGYSITDRGSVARSGFMLQSWVASPGASASSGDVALWVWLLLHGGVEPEYSLTPEVTHEVLHLLVCGLDLARSDAVHDGSWTIFDGTWSDDGSRSGVSGLATCRCGAVSELRLVAEVSSVTALLRQVLEQ